VLLPLLLHACPVQSGHDHLYERILKNGGFPYFVNGLGGASIYGFGASIAGEGTRLAGCVWTRCGRGGRVHARSMQGSGFVLMPTASEPFAGACCIEHGEKGSELN
jgi:hypothetical protein